MIKIKPYHHTPKIIWLDTNVINNIADAFTKKRNVDINKKVIKLYSKLKDLVDKNIIICPFLKQRDEYISTNVYDKSDEILLNLGRGKQLKTYLTSDSQIKRMLRLYFENGSEFYLDKNDIPYYGSEKEKKSRNEYKKGFSVIILQTGQNKDGIDKQNDKLADHLGRRKEYIIQNNKGFDDVFTEERQARKSCFKNTIDKIINTRGYIFTSFEYLSFDYCNIYPLIAYKEIFGKNDENLKEEDIEKVLQFLESEYLIPYDEISSKLVAKILTDNSKVKNTDVRDIESLLLIFPYASLVITDKAMKGNILQLKLDTRYDTKIFSLKDIDDDIFRVLDNF